MADVTVEDAAKAEKLAAAKKRVSTCYLSILVFPVGN